MHAVYIQVSKRSTQIENALANIRVNRRTYLRIRTRPKTAIERAVRFIYLNRTCFGGIHRTNRKGEFNVPFGGGERTPKPVYRDHLLKAAAHLLRRPQVQLFAADFQELLAKASTGDVVFCDPTYRAAGKDRFDRYCPTIFSWDDQIRLWHAASRAHSRGAVTIIMNAAEPAVRSLYKKAILLEVEKAKAIGNRAHN